MKILIAEDNSIAAKVLIITLQQLGHEVIRASDGEEAWQLFDQNPVRIIVSDWMMPNLDGLGLCERIRQRPDTAYTYFILLTAAYNDSAEHAKAMESGVDDFLNKPLEPETLYHRLRVAERILGFTAEISRLRKLIPMCSYCHRIRKDEDYWEKLETFLSSCSSPLNQISHGICPDCMAEQLVSFRRISATRENEAPRAAARI